MNILVLAKQVPDVSKITFNPETGRIVREGVPLSINSFDRRAVEEAIRIKEKSGARVMVASMGPPQAVDILDECLQMGADEAFLITDRKFGGADTWATSRILSHFIKIKSPDLVLAGKYSLDGETSQVPPQTSYMAGMNFVSGVSKLEIMEDSKKVTVEQDYEKGTRVITTSLPVLVSVSEKINRARRVPEGAPSMKDKVQIVNSESMKLDINGNDASLTVVSGTEALHNERTVKMISLDEVFELLSNKIKEGGSKKRPQKTVLNSDFSGGKILGVALDDRDSGMQIASKLNDLSFQINAEPVMIGNVDPNLLHGMSASEYIHFNSEDIYSISSFLADYIRKERPKFVIIPSNSAGKDVAGIISAELSLGLTADCVDLKIDGENLIQYKPAFGGGIVARITSKTKPEIATVRPGIFLEKVTDREMTVREIYLKNSERYEIVENRIIESKYIPLQSSNIVIGIGRGVKGKQTIDHVVDLGEKLGIAVGGTRPVVDMRLMPRQQQIGLTGLSIAPDLYIALGVAGMDYHIVGLRYAKNILAINNDPNAPIFRYADYGCTEDAQKFIDKLDAFVSNLT